MYSTNSVHKNRRSFILILLFSLVVSGVAIIFNIVSKLGSYQDIPQNIKSALNLPDADNSSENLEKIDIPITFGRKATYEVKDVFKNPTYFSITNLGSHSAISDITINEIDWTSNSTIAQTALRGKDNPSDEQKAFILWDYVGANIVHDYPAINTLYASILQNPIVLFNQFGYGTCNDFATALAVLADTVGLKTRVIHLKDHSVTEIFYNNNWHMFDANTGFMIYNPDGSVASVRDIFDDLSLLSQVSQYEEKYRYSRAVFIEAFSEGKPRRTQGKDNLLPKNYPIETHFTLKPGETVRYYYNFRNNFYWRDNDYRQYSLTSPFRYTNGLLISKFNNIRLGDAGNSFSSALPYPIVGIYLYSKNLCEYTKSIYFSLDKESWILVKGSCQDDVLNLTALIPMGRSTKPTYEYSLKITEPFMSVQIYTLFQLAPNSIPTLKNGRNFIEAKDKNSHLRLSFLADHN